MSIKSMAILGAYALLGLSKSVVYSQRNFNTSNNFEGAHKQHRKNTTKRKRKL